MRLRCENCGFIGNEDYFFRTAMLPDMVGRGLHEGNNYRCTKCGMFSEDYESVDSLIVFNDENDEWGRTMAIVNMQENYGEEVADLTNEEIERQFEELNPGLPLGGIVVLSDDEYSRKYSGREN